MDIKEIINEEFKSILTEGYVMEDDKLKFRQEFKNAGFQNYQSFSDDHDIDIIESDIIISWRVGFWLNQGGIEHFLVQGDSVEGTYKVELRNKQSDEVEQELDKNIAEEPWKFQIYDATLVLNEYLYIESLDFDFETKICTITFFDTLNKE